MRDTQIDLMLTLAPLTNQPRRNDMGSKDNPGDYDCYANALPNEPMFILLARDPSAPKLVDDWAANRMRAIMMRMRPLDDLKMVDEAWRCARMMREWRAANDGKWRRHGNLPELERLIEVARKP